MKVIFIAPKSNLPQKLLDKIESVADVYFFEDDPIDIRKIDLLKEKGDKILCPFPEPMNWNFPNEFIKEIPELKAICLSTTGYDWVDGKLARNLDIHLTYVPNPPNAVAEGTIFMMFAVARKYALSLKQDKFSFIPENYLMEVGSKTMGIIGLGKIGQRIAELGIKLGMNVIYWSKNSRNDNYNFTELDDLLQQSDFIFPCINSSEETKNFISKEKIDLIKPTGSVISIAHAGIIDQNYLTQKVANNDIFGCAFEEDRNSTKDYHGNVFVTFHNNWYTKETVEAKMELWVANIIGAIKNQPINLVN